ncbi:MAG: hypothetical protein GY787_12680 [Alteromonadales bacterium]|nr:hypothetical protein [Alteromonadales bacterium]
MADKNLSSIIGGGGVLAVSGFTAAQQISAGASGDLLVITPPQGKRAALNGLCVTSAGSDITGITITSGVRSVITSKTLTASDARGVNEFNIGTVFLNGSAGSPGNIDMIVGELDEVIIIKKDSGTISHDILYSSFTAEA